MPLQSTSGAASYDAFGGGAAAKVNYIEDFFQSYLRTGTGASATVTTGLDGSTKETLVWTKSRSAATNHKLTDNVRGATKALSSNTTAAEATDSQGLTAFSATGYTIGTNTDYNNSGATYVDWQWVAQPKFFDVVTYTGTGSNTTIAHALGSVPACIMVKRTNTTGAWQVYHRSLANTEYLVLNSTDAKATGATRWNSTTPTSTVFSLGTDATVNASGGTYVAYIFAHDAGGFGLTGTDNVISCGSFVGTGSDLSVNLGYEPQWLLVKRASSGTENWAVYDNMRGMFVNYDDNILFPNTSDAEVQVSRIAPTDTGFNVASGYPASGTTYIYIAIRRGPMKVPTSGTSVFAPVAYTGDGANNRAITTGFVSDMVWWKGRSSGTDWKDATLLIGTGRALTQNTTDAEEAVAGYYINTYNNTGFTYGTSDASYNTNSATYVVEGFKRAPGFMDVVCYTGNGSTQSITHNLTVLPELLIVKRRSGTATGWTALVTNISKYGYLNETLRFFDAPPEINLFGDNVNYVPPTSTAFTIGINNGLNASGSTYVAYLFATCAGVSKVFSYTGNGSSQTINCGFTGGARFVLIKRTDTTGDWYVWDTARGIVSGNDSHLSLNTADAEVTTDDTIDTDSTGFVVNQVSATNVNVSSATYIGLAIA